MSTMTGYARITKRHFYNLGGFSNPRCVRKRVGRSWAYFYRTD